MNSRYERENDLGIQQDTGDQDREISLGTATILGIFFVLAMLCAVFFGLGYSLGHRSAPKVVNASESGTEPDSSSSKPAPGSSLSETWDSSAGDQPSESPSPVSGSEDTQQGPAPERTAVVELSTEKGAKSHSTKPAAEVIAAPAEAVTGGPVVQVAAVSHQGDADMLAAALKKRGFTVSIRQTPQDRLLHLQMGPFASKKEADAVRQRLQADGYNAIVK